MADYLCITARFLQPFGHARADHGQPEWPPSPLRLFQTLTAGAAGHWNEREAIRTARPALLWLEQQRIEKIIAPAGIPSDSKYRLYVPDNVADKVAGSWSRGGNASIADHRTEKDVLAIQLDGEAVHYLLPVTDGCPHLDILRANARAMTHLGWGIDVIAGDAGLVTDEEAAQLQGETWIPSHSGQGTPMRVAVQGTLDDLMRKHRDFLDRLSTDQRGNELFRPVAPLSDFGVVPFRRTSDPQGNPHAVFELRHDNGSFCRYPQRKLMHIAGMVRHLAKEAMQKSPPSGTPPDWVEQFVVGHRNGSASEHRQFSYLPLPSIGHEYADQAVRRVMIAAPVGGDAWLEHLAARLAGKQLKPENGDEFGKQGPPTLVRVHRDKVARHYTAAASRWASVTPVILPGHDDRKPAKTCKLIEAALAQSGIAQPCSYEWHTFSCFRNSLSAHKYHKDSETDEKRWQFQNVRPYLRDKSWVHLTLTFNDELKVPGPLAIGAGRHCGFGLMAAVDDGP